MSDNAGGNCLADPVVPSGDKGLEPSSGMGGLLTIGGAGEMGSWGAGGTFGAANTNPLGS